MPNLNSTLSDSNKAFIAQPDSDQGRSARLQPGDLMLVITGAAVGRCALFTGNAEPGYVNQHVAICRLSNPNLDPRFVLWGLRGASGQEQLLGQRYGQGKPGLNLNNIRAIELPIPDLPEQVRIVDHLNRVEARVNALDALREETDLELSALLPAILDRAFRGEL
jgi:type I restriction enzyme S subunit